MFETIYFQWLFQHEKWNVNTQDMTISLARSEYVYVHVCWEDVFPFFFFEKINLFALALGVYSVARKYCKHGFKSHLYFSHWELGRI